MLDTYKTDHKIDTYCVGVSQQQQRGHKDHYEFIQNKALKLLKDMEIDNEEVPPPSNKRPREDNAKENKSDETDNDKRWSEPQQDARRSQSQK